MTWEIKISVLFVFVIEDGFGIIKDDEFHHIFWVFGGVDHGVGTLGDLLLDFGRLNFSEWDGKLREFGFHLFLVLFEIITRKIKV